MVCTIMTFRYRRTLITCVCEIPRSLEPTSSSETDTYKTFHTEELNYEKNFVILAQGMKNICFLIKSGQFEPRSTALPKIRCSQMTQFIPFFLCYIWNTNWPFRSFFFMPTFSGPLFMNYYLITHFVTRARRLLIIKKKIPSIYSFFFLI